MVTQSTCAQPGMSRSPALSVHAVRPGRLALTVPGPPDAWGRPDAAGRPRPGGPLMSGNRSTPEAADAAGHGSDGVRAESSGSFIRELSYLTGSICGRTQSETQCIRLRSARMRVLVPVPPTPAGPAAPGATGRSAGPPTPAGPAAPGATVRSAGPG